MSNRRTPHRRPTRLTTEEVLGLDTPWVHHWRTDTGIAAFCQIGFLEYWWPQVNARLEENGRSGRGPTSWAQLERLARSSRHERRRQNGINNLLAEQKLDKHMYVPHTLPLYCVSLILGVPAARLWPDTVTWFASTTYHLVAVHRKDALARHEAEAYARYVFGGAGRHADRRTLCDTTVAAVARASGSDLTDPELRAAIRRAAGLVHDILQECYGDLLPRSEDLSCRE